MYTDCCVSTLQLIFIATAYHAAQAPILMPRIVLEVPITPTNRDVKSLPTTYKEYGFITSYLFIKKNLP